MQLNVNVWEPALPQFVYSRCLPQLTISKNIGVKTKPIIFKSTYVLFYVLPILTPTTDDMFMMLPPPPAIILGRKALHIKNMLFILTFMVKSQSDSSVSSSDPWCTYLKSNTVSIILWVFPMMHIYQKYFNYTWHEPMSQNETIMQLKFKRY